MKIFTIKNVIVASIVLNTPHAYSMDDLPFSPYSLYITDVGNTEQEIQQLLQPNGLAQKLHLTLLKKREKASSLLMQHIAQLNNAPEIYYDTLKFAICTAIPPNDHIGTYLLQEKSISETMLIKYFSDNQHLKNFELIFLTVSKHKCKNTLCRLLAINKQLKGSLITKTLALQGLKKSICHESTKMLTALLKDHYLCKLFTPTAVEEIFECTIDKYCRFVVSAFLLFNLFNEKTAQQAYASILKTNNPKFIDFICSHPKFRKLLKQ